MSEQPEYKPKLSVALDGIVRFVGELTSWLCILLVAAIIVQVILRYVFGRGLVVLEELQWHFYGVMIMIAIPFGIVGAVAGHLIMGYNLSMLSIFGIVALSGVVVNDSLLLIDRVNRNRREDGTEVHQAVIDAGMRRFRPILLTSLTTFFGLSPMILEKSVQAKFLIPMAISLGFGILFATGITLILIPALYFVLEDFHDLFGLRSWLAGRRESQTSP